MEDRYHPLSNHDSDDKYIRILTELTFLKKTFYLQTDQNFAIDADWALNYSDFLAKRIAEIPKAFNNQAAANALNRGEPRYTAYYKINRIVWTFIKKIYGASPDAIIEENNVMTQNSVQNPAHTTNFMDLIVLKGAKLSPVGITNEHFFCYLNAVTQALLGVEPFTDALIERRKHGKIGPYTNALLEIINSHKSLEESDAKELKELVMETFNYRSQHDTHEVLIHILTYLRGELRHLTKNSTSQKQYYTSPILESFMGLVTNQMTCRSCKSTFQAHDPIIDISLPINSSHKTLNDCIDSYFAPEELSDPFQCPRCRTATTAYTQLVFERIPKVLILHLKRFREYPKREKIYDDIAFPVDYLNLTRYAFFPHEILNNVFSGRTRPPQNNLSTPSKGWWFIQAVCMEDTTLRIANETMM